jgi:hypothetical protein
METTNGLSNAKFVGVDLHTDQFTCRCLSKRSKTWQRTFKLNEDDIKEFFRMVDKNTYVALEATGNSFKFKEVIESYVKEVRIYNTYKLKLISHSGSKTDKIDAEKIATQLMIEVLSEMEQIKPVYVPNQNTQDLRALFTTYKQLNKQLTSTKNRIHALLKQNLYAHRKSQIFSEKNRTQIPLFFTTFNAFCFFSGKRVATGNFFAANVPNPHVVMAPSVFPSDATITRSLT